MGERLTVSVVIPCYNQGQFLREALESVEKSTYPHIEVIVVDDGSTLQESNACLEALQGYRIKGNRVKFIRQPNQGPAAARNRAIREAQGDFVLPLDADDRIDATLIEKGIWVLTKHPHVGFAYSSVQHFGKQNDVWHSRPYNFSELLYDNYVIVSSLFRRKLWEDIGGFDEKMPGYEDWDFWIRAGAAGYQGYWLGEVLFYYRKQDQSRLVADNRNRRKLIRALRQKNSEIYRNVEDGQRNRGGNKESNQRLALWKWRIFVFYSRLAGKVPPKWKDTLRGWIKPLIRKVFHYEETGFEQEQILGRNSVDEYIDATYHYQVNRDYQRALNVPAAANRPDGKLAILFVAPWMVVGGADKVNLDLIEQFMAEGHELHAFTTLASDHPWHARFQALTGRITHLGNWFGDLGKLLDYVIDYIHAHQIDVIQMSNSQLGYQIAETIKRYCPQVKLVDLIHMEEPYYPFDYFRYSVRFKDFFDHRVVITPYLKEAMVRKYGEVAERVTVIPNGIQVPADYEDTGYPGKQERSTRVIGFIGRMEEQKQPLDVIKTAHLVMKQRQDVKFVLIGGGSLLAPAQTLAHSLGIADKVEFLGSRNDAPQLMQEQFDIFFAPSLREGLPIVGLEALAFGVPIVATAVPGWFELVPEGMTGILLPVGDIEAFAEACLQLLGDQDRRMILSRQAYERACHVYAIEHTAAVYLDIYHSLMQGTEVATR